MSLYKRGGVWWFDFQVNGTRIRESTGLTNRSEAAQVEALRRAEFLRGEVQPKATEKSPCFQDFARTEFAAWSENQHREHPSTHEGYMRSVKVLTQVFAERPLTTISSADVERFKITRSRQQRKQAKDNHTLTPAAVNRELAVLRTLFNHAIRLGQAKVNPVANVKLLPEHNQ